MTHPSKRKGNGFEREIVERANLAEIEAKRAYASNGEALGHHPEVDVLVGSQRVQAKRRKALPAYLIPSEHVDAVVARADRGEPVVVMRLDDWLEWIWRDQRNQRRENGEIA